jgi:hypothetical protein
MTSINAIFIIFVITFSNNSFSNDTVPLKNMDYYCGNGNYYSKTSEPTTLKYTKGTNFDLLMSDECQNQVDLVLKKSRDIIPYLNANPPLEDHKLVEAMQFLTLFLRSVDLRFKHNEMIKYINTKNDINIDN